MEANLDPPFDLSLKLFLTHSSIRPVMKNPLNDVPTQRLGITTRNTVGKLQENIPKKNRKFKRSFPKKRTTNPVQYNIIQYFRGQSIAS